MTLTSRLARFLRRPPPPPAYVAPQAPPERWDDQFPSEADAEAWLTARRAAGRLYADLPAATVAALASRFPAERARTLAAAERILRHEFDLLGSGPFVPVDPDRPGAPDGYQPIDWALDPIAGLRFPRSFPHSTWNPQMRPGLADIKLPWELGRCQHWVPLGQAFRLTGDDRYAVEIVRQHSDFLAANPVGVGVQFVCTMDVAIRAFNWALAFELIRESPAFDDAARSTAYRSLFDHGVFIERNLENKYEVTSNHFLSNVVGLHGVARVLAGLPAAERWQRQCHDWLEQEMRVQVLDDGADYESSIPYHRLVFELFLAGACVSELAGTPPSVEYRARLHRMGEFLFGVLRPDGLLPQVGDADDGRLHILTDYGVWKPQDARHLAAPAALLLDEPSWLGVGDDTALWEAAWWGADISEVGASRSPSRTTRLFEQAGVAVANVDGAYLLVTNGRVGTNGFGNHKHNDLLAFEVHLDGVPLFVDAGSYVYTSDPEARNRFRATAYHNTVMVDGLEQNDLRPEYLFRLFETSTVEHLAFEDTAASVTYRGRHTGYARLADPVEHERTFELHKGAAALVIGDRLSGSGSHHFRWHFHAAPGLQVARADAGVFTLTSGVRRFTFRAPAELTAAVVDAWYSPSYGVRVPCRAIELSIDGRASHDRVYTFTLGPEGWRPH